MSDLKKLIAGIILVIIAISMLLSSNGALPVFGCIFGVAGAVLIVIALKSGKL